VRVLVAVLVCENVGLFVGDVGFFFEMAGACAEERDPGPCKTLCWRFKAFRWRCRAILRRIVGLCCSQHIRTREMARFCAEARVCAEGHDPNACI